jgi:hypothetical protein
MDIAGMWRSMRTDPTEVPRPGAQHTAEPGITISVGQQCQVALPLAKYRADEVSVTVTSHRHGAAGHVTIGANLNSSDGSYQGPTTTVGQGQFTATSSHVDAGFVVLPAAGWPVLGVGAVATWADGTADSAALTYVQLQCDPLVWWQWLIRLLAELARPLAPKSGRAAPRQAGS